jgi:phosphatidylinositol glycan class W
LLRAHQQIFSDDHTIATTTTTIIMAMNFSTVAAESCGSASAGGADLWPLLPTLPSPLLEVSMISLCLPLASAAHRVAAARFLPAGEASPEAALALEYAVAILPVVVAGTFVRFAPDVTVALAAAISLMILLWPMWDHHRRRRHRRRGGGGGGGGEGTGTSRATGHHQNSSKDPSGSRTQSSSDDETDSKARRRSHRTRADGGSRGDDVGDDDDVVAGGDDGEGDDEGDDIGSVSSSAPQKKKKKAGSSTPRARSRSSSVVRKPKQRSTTRRGQKQDQHGLTTTLGGGSSTAASRQVSAVSTRRTARGGRGRSSSRGERPQPVPTGTTAAPPAARRTAAAHHLDPTDAAAQATLRDAISSYRSATVLCTCFIILAVDFRRVFPHCATKSRYHGVSLMDLGSGQYIFLNALYHHRRRLAGDSSSGKQPAASASAAAASAAAAAASAGRNPRPTAGSSVTGALSASAGLLMVGIVRQLLVVLMSYGVDEREYGIDLNFFVILATVRLAAAAALALAERLRVPAPALGAAILAAHQWVLQLPGVTDTVLNDERGSLLLRNKEGLAQIVGCTGMYLLCTGIGSYLWTEARGDPVLHPHRGKVLAPLAAVAAAAMGAAHLCAVWIDPPSRRLANASYALWVIGFSVSLLASFVLAHASTPPARAVVAEAVSRNMLPLFLVSNVAVGIINNVANLSAAGAGDAFIIMAAYTAVLCTLAVYVEEGIRTAFLFVSFGGARARQQQQ